MPTNQSTSNIPEVHHPETHNPNASCTSYADGSPDGCSTPAEPEKAKRASAMCNQQKGVSDKKASANRKNAKLSTGPKSVRGKQQSSGNAFKHGLLSKPILYTPDGRVRDPELVEFREELLAIYGNDLRTEIAVDLLIVEYHRQGLALQAECEIIAAHEKHWISYLFHKDMALLHRYNSSSSKNISRLLLTLERYAAERQKQVVETEDDIDGESEVETGPETADVDLLPEIEAIFPASQVAASVNSPDAIESAVREFECEQPNATAGEDSVLVADADDPGTTGTGGSPMVHSESAISAETLPAAVGECVAAIEDFPNEANNSFVYSTGIGNSGEEQKNSEVLS